MSPTIVFIAMFLVWLFTAIYAASERQERMKAEAALLKTVSLSRLLSTVVKQKSKSDEAVQDEIRPLVEGAKAFEMSGADKRHRVLMAYLREHKGASYRQASEAIEAVLGKTQNG